MGKDQQDEKSQDRTIQVVGAGGFIGTIVPQPGQSQVDAIAEYREANQD